MKPKKDILLVVTLLWQLLVVLGIWVGAHQESESTSFPAGDSSKDLSSSEEVVSSGPLPGNTQRLPECLFISEIFSPMNEIGWISACDGYYLSPPLETIEQLRRAFSPMELEAIELWYYPLAGVDPRGLFYPYLQLAGAVGYSNWQLEELGENMWGVYRPDRPGRVYFLLRDQGGTMWMVARLKLPPGWGPEDFFQFYRENQPSI